MAIVLKPFTGKPQYISRSRKWAPRLVLVFGALALLSIICSMFFGRLLGAKLGVMLNQWPFLFVPSSILVIFWANNARKDAFGRAGEEEVARILDSLPNDCVVLHSIVMPFDQGTFEIDHLVLTPQRGYVVETKAFVGSLRGTVTDRRWTKTKLSNRWNLYAMSVGNPIKQNNFHIVKLREWIRSQPAESSAAKARKYWWENVVVLTGDVVLSDDLAKAKEICRTYNLAPRLVTGEHRGGPSRIEAEGLGKDILATAQKYEGKHRPKTSFFRLNFATPDRRSTNTARLYMNKARKRRF